MRKLTTYLVLLAVVMACSIAGIVIVTRNDQIQWPAFEAAKPEATKAPQVVTAYERDYGWRTADVIPILVFIKQQPGTKVDLHSLAVEGDFDIISEPEYFTRDFADGSRLIRVRFKIQSMKVQKQLALKTSMLVRDNETRKDHLITIPAFAPYTSPTWDGRDVVQDGQPGYEHGRHNWVTMAYVFGGLLGLGLLMVLRRRWMNETEATRLSGWETRRQIARRDFEAVWDRFENGDYSAANYQEIARILRTLFLIESKVTHEIEMELGSAHPFRLHILSILNLCGKVLYKQEVLKEKEQKAIRSLFDQICPPSVLPQSEPEQVTDNER